MARHLILLLSGVPQGSVIEPLLFLIHIVMILPLSVGRQLTVYADETLLYRPISCQRDFAALQEDINKLDIWVNTNYLQFSTCIFSRKTKKIRPYACIPYFVGSLSWVCWVFQIPDTSITRPFLDCPCWVYMQEGKEIIGTTVQKILSICWATDPTQAVHIPGTSTLSSVWNPYLQKKINTLEDIQKFALQALGPGLLPATLAI